ncbi:MAG: response regulator [Chloroflexi bacterium]|jgi:DNA-binding response OmpR family regulator|nr:response regulator [Chloroflexota bacterium]
MNVTIAPKVVYIEDEPEMFALVELILEDTNIEFISAVGGQEGLRIIREEQPDLILLDIMMPEVDGWDVYRSLKADPQLSTIPVIIITAKVKRIDQILAQEIVGVDAYITKPFSPSDLLQRVKEFLSLTG